MRLIDADELIERIKTSNDYLGKWDEMNIHDIEVAKTIDAIVLDGKTAYVKLKSVPKCCARCPVENVGKCLAKDVHISTREMDDENNRPCWCSVIVGKENG